MAAAGAGAGAAAAAAVAQAIKASGAIIDVEPEEFQRILSRMDEGLVIQTLGGFRKKTHEYLAAYRGFFFHTKSDKRMSFPSGVEMVWAKKIWVP
jgi:hypothetical protein